VRVRLQLGTLDEFWDYGEGLVRVGIMVGVELELGKGRVRVNKLG